MSSHRFFRVYIADLNAFFEGLLPPPEVGGEVVFDHEMSDPLQGRLHHLLSQPDDIQQIFSLDTRKYTAGDKLGKKVEFWRTWFSSPTSQVCTMAAEWTTNSEPFRQLFPQAQVLIQKTKNSVNRTWWACTRTFPVARHPSQLTDGDSGDEILDSLNFLWNCRWLCSSVFLQALMVQIMRFVVYLWSNLTPKAWSVINIFFAEAFFGPDLPSNEISDSS